MKDEEIVEKLEENDIFTTDDPAEAIYVLRDGTLISGDFEYGSRGEDHSCIERVFADINRYTKSFWEEMFKRTEVVMLVPECNEAYYYEPITAAQRNVVEELGYNLRDYDDYGKDDDMEEEEEMEL